MQQIVQIDQHNDTFNIFRWSGDDGLYHVFIHIVTKIQKNYIVLPWCLIWFLCGRVPGFNLHWV